MLENVTTTVCGRLSERKIRGELLQSVEQGFANLILLLNLL